MEEDIKILEEQLNIYKRHLENYEKEECLTSVYYELKKYAQALENLLTRYKFLEENQLWSEATIEELKKDFIPKSKLKDFFSSRLEKYQEADDGRYEQDYLTRGELELVDRYKECKEIAKIILEEEVNREIPQDCIPKSKIEEQINWLDNDIKNTKNKLEEGKRPYPNYIGEHRRLRMKAFITKSKEIKGRLQMLLEEE